MESKRFKEPIAGELIYHYCSAETFYNITSNQSIRFGDVAQMNDSFEMAWGFEFFKKVLVEWGKNKDITNHFFEKCMVGTHKMREIFKLFCSCFSTVPDQLSQWRGYADDGKGFSIGFDFKSIFETLPVKPLEVSYDIFTLEQEIAEMVGNLYIEEGKRNFKYGTEFKSECFNIACEFAGYKNPFFYEEKEIRLVHKVNVLNFKDESKYLADNDKKVFGNDHMGQEIKFQMRGHQPIPYIEYNFKKLGKWFPLAKVIIGPKNPSSINDITLYLNTIGLHDIVVEFSTGSYR